MASFRSFRPERFGLSQVKFKCQLEVQLDQDHGSSQDPIRSTIYSVGFHVLGTQSVYISGSRNIPKPGQFPMPLEGFGQRIY